MAKTDFKTVAQYLAAQPKESRVVLQQVRAVIRKAIPRATEVISYQIPAYRLPEGTVICFAGWKEHYSLYAVTSAVLAKFGTELKPYLDHKATMRFPLDQAVPERLIRGIVKCRAEETVARAKAKAAKRAASRRRSG